MFSTQASTQKGTALIFTMVFLGIMVAAGLVAIQIAGLQQKMAASYRNHQSAFIAAESGLKEAEKCIKEKSECTNMTGFTQDCSGGLCFAGTDIGSISACRTSSYRPWQDINIWNDRQKTREVTSLASSGVSARYMIEFMCYVPNVLFGVQPSTSNPADWANLYRVTVLASVNNQNSRVMLQSTYKR